MAEARKEIGNDIEGKNFALGSSVRPGGIKPVTFVAFCETNLRYEGGTKAMIFLGPYLLGCAALELVVISESGFARWGVWPWLLFLAYLVLFPPMWKRFLNYLSRTHLEKI